jgi:16S rRNA (guanine966-N2)-methyltransferase
VDSCHRLFALLNFCSRIKLAIRITGDRALHTPVGLTTRPTASKVRLAVCNIWQSLIYDSAWLDLCAGSGAMSAEALVRGAKSVVAIEQSPAVCQLIKKNLQKVSSTHNWRVIKGDVLKVLGKLQGEVFDLVYFDPPYASGLYLPVLQLLPSVLDADSRVAVEHSTETTLPDRVHSLAKYDLRQYGHTALSFYGLDTD